MKKQALTISEQLKQTLIKMPNIRRLNMPQLQEIGTDGVDHINVWEHGETSLGRGLSSLADLPFTHKTFGKFRSVEGFWHYVRFQSKDDSLRNLKGVAVRRYVQELEAAHPEKTVRVADFRAMIADANWQKLKSWPLLAEEFKDCQLPLDGYYTRTTNTDLRIRMTSSVWFIPGLVEIRNALIDNRLPDFTFLLDSGQGVASSTVKVRPPSLADIYSPRKNKNLSVEKMTNIAAQSMYEHDATS